MRNDFDTFVVRFEPGLTPADLAWLWQQMGKAPDGFLSSSDFQHYFGSTGALAPSIGNPLPTPSPVAPVAPVAPAAPAVPSSDWVEMVDPQTQRKYFYSANLRK